ncbi:DUF1566 domain-containing protein [Flavobacteriaceae bacterium]|jgi:hypothetical protein|nr:DUF1566 domain-containing protein [Flavobacteriaceae bacterium]MDC1539743.1 DUF1566 domain-containing protein [Flavobacteriaceae bacterium]
MKHISTLLAAVLLTATTYAQIGINNENPDASAALDITSTTGGLLPPRMSETNRDEIPSAVAGLLIWCSDCGISGQLQVFNGTEWTNLTGGTAETTLQFENSNVSFSPNLINFTSINQSQIGYIKLNEPIISNGSDIGVTIKLKSDDPNISINPSEIYWSSANWQTIKTFTIEVLSGLNQDLYDVVSAEVITNSELYNGFVSDFEVNYNDPNTEPKVGDFYRGGVVFYILQEGDAGYVSGEIHGLVCSFSDVATSVEWGCYGTDLPNVLNVPYNGGTPLGLGAEIGDGFNNTNDILQDCPTAPAALAARSLGAQWFLPSAKELNQMYLKKEILEGVSGFTAFSNSYWSSTEGDDNNAWEQFFNFGYQFFYYKNFTDSVRAVRAF